MNFYKQQFATAVKLLNDYDGKIPLQHFLKNYYNNNKKHGSKDRKNISHFCYCYYRLGKALHGETIENKLQVALFFCSTKTEDVAGILPEYFLQKIYLSLTHKIELVKEYFPTFSAEEIFSTKHRLSYSISSQQFALSHLIQPKLFVRVRPNKENIVLQKLEKEQITFQQINTSCLTFSNATNIAKVLEVNKEVVIQDYSSQQIASFFQLIKQENKPIYYVWDCCAASGGKSILAKDILQKIQLTVSDIRPSILQNLITRLQQAAINLQNIFVADLTQKNYHNTQLQQFDLVIADVPCTGSGTWSRTPEQLYFFNEKKVHEFTLMQKSIIENIIPSIKPKGFLLYITCSVFEAENEALVSFIQQKFQLQLIKQEIFKGYNTQADTMFAAILVKK